VEKIELRPLSLGELLDRTFALYRSHFWLFVGIMAIPSCISIPMNAFLLAMQGGIVPRAAPSPRIIGGLFAGYFALFIVFLIAYGIATGASTYAVSDSYLGREATVRGSYGKVRGNIWRIVGLMINVMLRFIGIMILFVLAVGAVILGIAFIGRLSTSGSGGSPVFAIILGIFVVLLYLAGVVFSVFIMLRYAVAIPAMLLEQLKIMAAIRRSVHLTQGRRGQIFVASLLTMIIAYIGVVVFQGPFLVATLISASRGHTAPWLTFLMSVCGAIGGALTGPLLMIVLVLCYYDSRIRKEAFDLQYMMSSLEPPPTPGVVSPA
jgi:hypothetical protein